MNPAEEELAPINPAGAPAAGVPALPAVPRTSGIVWKAALTKCLAAAGFSLLLTFLLARLELFGLLLSCTLGGAFAAWLYGRKQAAPMNGGIGAKLGAVAGLFHFLFYLIICVVAFLLKRAEFVAEINSKIREAAEKSGPQAVEIMSNPATLAFIITLGVVFLFGFFLLLGTAGGAIQGTMMRHSEAPPSRS